MDLGAFCFSMICSVPTCILGKRLRRLLRVRKPESTFLISGRISYTLARGLARILLGLRPFAPRLQDSSAEADMITWDFLDHRTG